MIQPYYLQHGQMLDSEHSSIEKAEKRARSLLKHYGSNHFQIRIGIRNGSDSRVMIIYHEQRKYVEKKELTQHEVLAEIKRLTRIYNDMIHPRTINGEKLQDGEMIELVRIDPDEISHRRIGERGVFVKLTGDCGRIRFLTDGEECTMNYRFFSTSVKRIDYEQKA
jgi:hypothetical protein